MSPSSSFLLPLLPLSFCLHSLWPLLHLILSEINLWEGPHLAGSDHLDLNVNSTIFLALGLETRFLSFTSSHLKMRKIIPSSGY